MGTAFAVIRSLVKISNPEFHPVAINPQSSPKPTYVRMIYRKP
jgi:hypothetical protein